MYGMGIITNEIFAVDRTRHHKEGSKMGRKGRKGILKLLTISLVNHVDGWWPMCKEAKKKRKELYRRNAGKCDQPWRQANTPSLPAVATRMNDRQSNHRLLLSATTIKVIPTKRKRTFALCPHERSYNSMSNQVRNLDIRIKLTKHTTYFEVFFI